MHGYTGCVKKIWIFSSDLHSHLPHGSVQSLRASFSDLESILLQVNFELAESFTFMPFYQMNRRECLFVMSRKKLSLDYSIKRLHLYSVVGEGCDHVVGNRAAPGVRLSAALVLQFTLATRKKKPHHYKQPGRPPPGRLVTA